MTGEISFSTNKTGGNYFALLTVLAALDHGEVEHTCYLEECGHVKRGIHEQFDRHRRSALRNSSCSGKSFFPIFEQDAAVLPKLSKMSLWEICDAAECSVLFLIILEMLENYGPQPIKSALVLIAFYNGLRMKLVRDRGHLYLR